jgi:hypothetical protein
MKHKITKWQTDTTTSPSPTVQVKWFGSNEMKSTNFELKKWVCQLIASVKSVWG